MRKVVKIVVTIGYWELVAGTSFDITEGKITYRYMSIPEAIFHETQHGREVELHFATTEDDERRIAPLRQKAIERKRQDAAMSSKYDGWVVSS